MRMTWNRLYVIKSYIRGSLWLVPFFSVLLYLVVSRITHGVGLWLIQTGRIDEATAYHGGIWQVLPNPCVAGR